MLFFPKIIEEYSEIIVDDFGYVNFFIATALIELSIIILIIIFK